MNYDDFADLYDHQYDLYRDDLHFYAQLCERVGGSVLEIGAGTGRVTAYLARRGVDVTGLEPSAKMLEKARQRAEREGLGLRWCKATRRPLTSRPLTLPSRPLMP